MCVGGGGGGVCRSVCVSKKDGSGVTEAFNEWCLLASISGTVSSLVSYCLQKLHRSKNMATFMAILSSSF